MANNYQQFSEMITGITPEMEQWVGEQLEVIEVSAADVDPDAHGPHGVYDMPRIFADELKRGKDCKLDPDSCESVGFMWEFEDTKDDDKKVIGRHLWLHSDESCDLEHVAHFVQKLFKQFDIKDCWTLTYSATCSKPRTGEFGGGALFVTADRVEWQNAHYWADRQQADHAAGIIQDAVWYEARIYEDDPPHFNWTILQDEDNHEDPNVIGRDYEQLVQIAIEAIKNAYDEEEWETMFSKLYIAETRPTLRKPTIEANKDARTNEED